jgi:hypothetical protein
MIRPVPVFIVGAKMASSAFPMIASYSVSPWLCGMAKTRLSRSACSGLATAKVITARIVKEYYFYLDSTPTHSYMKYLYKYPPIT